MRIAIYGTEIREEYLPVYQKTFELFRKYEIELVLSEEIRSELHQRFQMETTEITCFRKDLESCPNIDLLLSIGGDGTFLSAVPLALDMDIPMAGVNCGRLGFLADISPENLEEALLQFMQGDYTLEQRVLLELIHPTNLFPEFNYAVNELTVHKLDNSSMITIATQINGEFLANYWADGLIIATPTGSTAYSLSVGGPIVTPELEGLIITPIASHHLTVRPVVVPDDVEIELSIGGRGNQFLVSIDHRSAPLDFSQTIRVRKAAKTVSIVKFNNLSFYATLRNKLMWGADRRNPA
ncbi:MAG TPA: NAD kinase [Prolixibacteraceae bacterium]|nr:NAD kinase [Prolixibacteraceae bacterium]